MLGTKAEGIHHVDLRVTSYRRSVLFYDVILLLLGFRRGFVKGEKVTYDIRDAYCYGGQLCGYAPLTAWETERYLGSSMYRIG